MSTPASPPQPSPWNRGASPSLVEFSARHMMITTVKGRMAELRGAITIDEANPERSSVNVEVDAASIDTRSEQRDGHLRSADFLDVAQFPTVSFRSKRVEGDPTIHGTTREVTLDATFEGRGRDPWGGERVSFSAQTKIDRRDFGLTWNAALEAGGVLVSNDVKIHIEAQAVKA